MHCHPTNKLDGVGWEISFGGWGNHKCDLMAQSRGTHDTFSNLAISFPRLHDAVCYAKAMGWGYDIMHPTSRWHTKKDYASNFKWKGPAKPVEDYD